MVKRYRAGGPASGVPDDASRAPVWQAGPVRAAGPAGPAAHAPNREPDITTRGRLPDVQLASVVMFGFVIDDDRRLARELQQDADIGAPLIDRDAQDLSLRDRDLERLFVAGTDGAFNGRASRERDHVGKRRCWSLLPWSRRTRSPLRRRWAAIPHPHGSAGKQGATDDEGELWSKDRER